MSHSDRARLASRQPQEQRELRRRDTGELPPPELVAEPAAYQVRDWPRTVALVAGGVVAVVVLVAAGVLAGLWIGGPTMIEIPDVVGQDVAGADATLREAGFLIGLDPEPGDPALPRYEVTATYPVVGTARPQGSVVRITYRAGNGSVLVPPVPGLPSREAQILLRQAGLAVGEIITQPDETVPEDHVIACDPAPGAELPSDTPVRLVVSSGSPAAAQDTAGRR